VAKKYVPQLILGFWRPGLPIEETGVNDVHVSTFFRRMEVSCGSVARNQLKGMVSKITPGPVNAEVIPEPWTRPASGGGHHQPICPFPGSTEGNVAYAIVKASPILIGGRLTGGPASSHARFRFASPGGPRGYDSLPCLHRRRKGDEPLASPEPVAEIGDRPRLQPSP